MTNAEILTKAIQKAIDGGWPWEFMNDWAVDHGIAVVPKNLKPTDRGLFVKQLAHPMDYGIIIFRHDFAKALWGEEIDESVAQYIPMTGESESPSDVEDWYGKAHYDGPTYKYHLMMMVIAPNPIAYLGEHI